jgi:hypothetical protein
MMQIGEFEERPKVPTKANKPRAERRVSEPTTENLPLPQRVYVKAPGLRLEVTTVEGALRFIDDRVASELAKLPRWTFARALLAEALKTRKTRDLRTAFRQLTQALSNEHWLDVGRGDR